jgi:hypothetical protein
VNLESIKEQLIERWNSIWERIRDTDSFIQAKERYQNLSPTMQKVVTASGLFFAGLIILAIPLSLLSSSSESVENFENNVRLVRDFYRIQRELQTTPMVPATPPAGEIANNVQSIVQAAGLSADQISGPREINPEREANNALQPPGITEHGAEITLIKLNVKQVADIGAKLSQIAGGLHLTALDMKANAENDHYYDVIFRVTGFTVPGAGSDTGGEAPSAEPEGRPAPPAPNGNAPPSPPPPASRLKPKPETPAQ